MYCIHFSGLLQAPGSSLPKDQLSGAQEPHSQPHVQAQTEFSKKETGPNGSSQTLSSKLSSPSTTPLPGKTVQRATCGPKPASSLPGEAPACFVRPQRRLGASAPGRPSQGLVTAGAAQRGSWSPKGGPVSPHGLKRCCAVCQCL